MRTECNIYNKLAEEDREANYASVNYYCDRSDRIYNVSQDWKGAGWYRFQHPAGILLAQSPPGANHCGTVATGWSNSTLPDKPGDSVDIKICFQWSGNDCYESNEGKVTNCGSYFIYYLDNVPACDNRYCGSN